MVDAVESTVEIQEELKGRNAELPENRRMAFRIGVNLGDVIEDGERIYGDGINIAARIEGLAESLKRALELCQKVIALDDSQADAYSLLGTIYLLQRQFDKAIDEGERAVALNPNGADHHVWLAMILTSAGRPEEAISLLEKAMRLSPFPPNPYSWCLGNAYALAGRYEEAVAQYKKALELSPDYLLAYVGLKASLWALGREQEARAAAAEVLRIHPKFSLKDHANALVFDDQTYLELYLNALRGAGLQ